MLLQSEIFYNLYTKYVSTSLQNLENPTYILSEPGKDVIDSRILNDFT